MGGLQCMPPIGAWLVTQPGRAWSHAGLVVPPRNLWIGHQKGGLIYKLFLGASTGTKMEESTNAASGPASVPRVRHSELCSPKQLLPSGRWGASPTRKRSCGC